jgi:single-stranded-DNA-specific exonuclease
VFAVPRARVVKADRIGREATTLRLMVEGEGGGPRLKAMLFRGADTALGQAVAARGGPVHLAGHLRAEAWNGTVAACFVVTDAAAA